MPLSLTADELARKIDHTVLKAEATAAVIDKVVEEALHWKVAAVCVNPLHVGRVAQALAGSGVRTCTVAGFPLGTNVTRVKVYEAGAAVEDGAEEVDMVISLAHALAGDYGYVENDVRAVAKKVHEKPGTLLKVILETAVLSADQIKACCLACKRAGADFVKTSTGFHPAGGASVEAVRLMKSAFGGLVKAAGGIRTREQALAMVEAGADRLGLSATVQVLEGMK